MQKNIVHCRLCLRALRVLIIKFNIQSILTQHLACKFSRSGTSTVFVKKEEIQIYNISIRILPLSAVALKSHSNEVFEYLPHHCTSMTKKIIATPLKKKLSGDSHLQLPVLSVGLGLIYWISNKQCKCKSFRTCL